MSRLWDKGVDLDQRVLAYTAGDDYALDERLVQYDVRASIAHAEMLNAQKLLADADLKVWRAVPADQRPRTLKLAQEEVNALRDELRRRM